MANTQAMESARYLNASDSTRKPVLTGAVLLVAAVFGLAAGLAFFASPLARSLSGIAADYPLRVALPEVSIPSPSLDVLTTPDTDGAEQPSPQQIVPERAGPAAPDAGSVEGKPLAEKAATPIAASPGGMLALDYDLAQYASANQYDASDGSIQTRMPLIVDGVASGTAEIRVVDNAQILIATSSVAQAIGARASSLSPRLASALENGTGFLPFYELRAAGIDVQYDAVQDRIALTLPS